MKISFKGSPKEMTEKQKEFFAKLMEKLKKQKKSLEFHFGDSKGADESAYNILLKYDLVNKIVIHPAREDKTRIFSEKNKAKNNQNKIKTYVREEVPLFSRNHKLVEMSDLVIITTESKNDKAEAETSSVIRYSKTRKKKFITISPDGQASKWPTTKPGPALREVE